MPDTPERPMPGPDIPREWPTLEEITEQLKHIGPLQTDPSLNDLKLAFAENQLPELQGELAAFIFNHPILGELPPRDQRAAAYSAAVHLLLAIRSESVVGLVR